MTIYQKTKRVNNYRSIYRKHHGKIPKDELGRSFDIHHIDGDHRNNDPSNLVAIPIEEHYNIHLERKDYRAAALIAIRMNKDAQVVSSLASLAARKRVSDGTHHWLTGESQKKSNRQRVANGTHHLLKNDMQKMNAIKRIEDGTHNFLKASKCPHCGKEGKNSAAMNRWHFDACKFKP